MISGTTIGVRDVEDAAARLAGIAVRTPLIENAELNERAGGVLDVTNADRRA